MAGIYKVNIVESVDELKQLLCAQKGASDKERIHLLYRERVTFCVEKTR